MAKKSKPVGPTFSQVGGSSNPVATFESIVAQVGGLDEPTREALKRLYAEERSFRRGENKEAAVDNAFRKIARRLAGVEGE